MERTESGTSVGVDDPYEFVDRCDYLSEGRCRFAVEYAEHDQQFARERRAEEFQCPVAGDPTEDGPTGPWDWQDCPQFRCRNRETVCLRCGLTEQRLAHDEQRPLLEEHHLSYAKNGGHEITVVLCRWCHARVHNSWGRIDDDVSPDPAALAAQEARRSKQHEELGFESAAKRRKTDDG